MILNPSLAKLVIALGLVLVLGPFHLHAEQERSSKPLLQPILNSNTLWRHATSMR
jgi:hypothetical protein